MFVPDILGCDNDVTYSNIILSIIYKLSLMICQGWVAFLVQIMNGWPDNGKAFVKNIANATKSDVAASQDLTGPAWLGGNWKLEFQYGIINYLSDFIINVCKTL